VVRLSFITRGNDAIPTHREARPGGVSRPFGGKQAPPVPAAAAFNQSGGHAGDLRHSLLMAPIFFLHLLGARPPAGLGGVAARATFMRILPVQRPPYIAPYLLLLPISDAIILQLPKDIATISRTTVSSFPSTPGQAHGRILNDSRDDAHHLRRPAFRAVIAVIPSLKALRMQGTLIALQFLLRHRALLIVHHRCPRRPVQKINGHLVCEFPRPDGGLILSPFVPSWGRKGEREKGEGEGEGETKGILPSPLFPLFSPQNMTKGIRAATAPFLLFGLHRAPRFPRNNPMKIDGPTVFCVPTPRKPNGPSLRCD